LGMEIDLTKVPNTGITRDDFLLFSESASRFVVTVQAKFKEDFERELRALAQANNRRTNGSPVPSGTEFAFAHIGMVNSNERFVVTGLSGAKIIDVKSSELKDAWQKTMDW